MERNDWRHCRRIGRLRSWTSSQQRNQVVRFSIGNQDIVKTFFIKRDNRNQVSLTLFIKPFSTSTWLSILVRVIVVGLILIKIIQVVNDKGSIHFNLTSSLTFSFSGIMFVRRWSTTPVSFSTRIVFISVLYIGIIVQGMLKASFTSVLKKEVVLYDDLEDLLNAGFNIAIEAGSAQEGYYR